MKLDVCSPRCVRSWRGREGPQQASRGRVGSLGALVALPLLATVSFTAGFGSAGWARPPAGGPGTAMLRDKTLVAWVYPANLDQRGGSVLTIIDKAEHFDAIVLGEVAEGRWMAGSDFFRRTERNQSDWPVARARGDRPVQLAIVYEGRKITILRDGEMYASYEIREPQPFGSDAMVLVGLRYVGNMGEIGFFEGAVEDVRIYDRPLTEGEIASLAADTPSDPGPLAWWTFEDGRANDLKRTFAAVRLEGDARIADGKLHLGGAGYLWAAKDEGLLVLPDEGPDPIDRTPQKMFYKARSRRTGNMWDTWLYLHEGTYYLYYLAKSRGSWDNISMAASPDGVHWSELGRVLWKRRGVTWMGTGSTWRSPRHETDGRFFMNFSEWRGPRQTIFFAESKDLVNWTRLGDEHEFRQDERWYERNGRWDCIWTIPKPGGEGSFGYWTATPRKETGGRFGFGETRDGVTWRALEPPKVVGVGEGEVGAVERIGSRYYMMFGTRGMMVTLVADRPEGPFYAAKRNFRLLSGHTYFSRFFPVPGGILANHHSIARNGQVYFGTLKAAVVDPEGTLRLGWWPGNDAMKVAAVDVEMPRTEGDRRDAGAIEMLGNTFDGTAGLILDGRILLPEVAASPRRGLYIETGRGSGTAILLDTQGAAELGPMEAEGSAFSAEKTVDREVTFPRPVSFCLLLRESLLEFYLGDVLIECYSLPGDATGRVGLIRGGSPGAIFDLAAWR